MTDSKTYKIAGADVIITVSGYVDKITVHITVDLSPLDIGEPDHSPHNLMSYFALPGYHTSDKFWWCKAYRQVNCATGSQARRVIKTALTRLDDAISGAILARNCRKAEILAVLA